MHGAVDILLICIAVFSFGPLILQGIAYWMGWMVRWCCNVKWLRWFIYPVFWPLGFVCLFVWVVGQNIEESYNKGAYGKEAKR